MRKKIVSVFKYLLFLGIGVFLIWWQVSKMTELQKVQFTESLKNMHFIYLIPIFGMAILSHWSRALRWRLLMEPMGYKPSRSNTFYATLTGYFANNFVPRAGEIMRCTVLSKYEKIPFAKVLGTVITERLFDFISYIVIIFITVIIQIGTVKEFILEKTDALFAQKTGSVAWLIAGIGLAFLIGGFFLVKWIFKRFPQKPFILNIQNILHGLKEGLLTIMTLKKKRAFFLHTIFIWAMYLLQVYVGFRALDVTAHLTVAAAFSVLSLSTLAMIISPGGIGAFPVAVQQVLLVYHVDNISFGWLIWGANTGIIIVLGLLSFLLLNLTNKHEAHSNYTAENLHAAGDEGTDNTLETNQ